MAVDTSSVGTDTFSASIDTPANYTNQGGKIVAVNDDEDALVFIDASSVGTDTDTFIGLTDTPGNYISAGGKLVAVNSSGDALEFIDASGVGNDTFVGLTDTPSVFSGQDNKLVAVNSDGSALEFIDAFVTEMILLWVLPILHQVLGQDNKSAAVTSGDALEFIDAGGVGTDTDTFTGLTDTPSSLSGQGNKLVSAGIVLEMH